MQVVLETYKLKAVIYTVGNYLQVEVYLQDCTAGQKHMPELPLPYHLQLPKQLPG